MRVSSILLAAAALVDSVIGTAPSKACCSALARESSLRRKVYLRGTPSYEESIESIWSLSARQLPYCVVLPESAQDTSKIIKVITRHQCPFSVRGGGHSASALTNSVEDGVGIDFARMKTIKYRKDKGIVEVGPGTRSVEIYDAIEQYGVAVTAGRGAPVGVAGFFTGGGNSYFANSHGFASDNIANFEVVLADGSIVNANKKKNSDLWVALRGGSGNVGLVTRFDLRTIPYTNPSKPRIFGGAVGYTQSKENTAIKAYIDFVDEYSGVDNHSSATIWSQYDSDVGGDTRLYGRLINTADISNPPALSGFLDFGGVTSSTLRSDTLANVSREFGGWSGGNLYNIWFTGSFSNDERVILRAQDMHRQIVRDIIAILSPGAYFFTRSQYQPLTSAMANNGDGGDNVMGLKPHTDRESGFLYLIYIAVANAEDEQKVIPLAKKYIADLNAYATSLGSNWDWLYLPYANGLQDAIATFGDEAIGRLRKVSRKYDPRGVFQKLKSAGFKIPRA